VVRCGVEKCGVVWCGVVLRVTRLEAAHEGKRSGVGVGSVKAPSSRACSRE